MGFEKDYEKGLRDKHWGRAIRSFARSESAVTIGRGINTALCAALREMEPSGEQKSLLELMDIFVRHRRQIMFQRSLFHEESDYQKALDRFRIDSLPIMRSEENSTKILILHDVAMEQLEDLYLTVSQAEDSANARTTLCIEFLRHLIAAQMNAAIVVVGQKAKVNPEVPEARVREAISQVPLDEIATQFLAGKGKKLRAPRSPRRTGTQLASTSLLKLRKQ